MPSWAVCHCARLTSAPMVTPSERGLPTTVRARLEEHLGTRLLHRSTRRLSLSEAGETYLARVRGVRTDPERLLICSGYTQGLGLLCAAPPQRPRLRCT